MQVYSLPFEWRVGIPIGIDLCRSIVDQQLKRPEVRFLFKPELGWGEVGQMKGIYSFQEAYSSREKQRRTLCQIVSKESQIK